MPDAETTLTIREVLATIKMVVVLQGVEITDPPSIETLYTLGTLIHDELARRGLPANYVTQYIMDLAQEHKIVAAAAEAHTQRQRQLQLVKTSPYVCKQCSKRFPTSDKRNQHALEHPRKPP